jgi:two-component system NarL family response regulator
MLKAGAAAYLLKNSAFDELVRAIRAVIAGESYLSPEIASVLTRHVAGGSAQVKDPPTSDELSGREREVLQLLAEGNTSKEIATRLHIAARTIESHRREIMRKLNLHSVAALTKYAIRHGITSLEA